MIKYLFILIPLFLFSNEKSGDKNPGTGTIK